MRDRATHTRKHVPAVPASSRRSTGRTRVLPPPLSYRTAAACGLPATSHTAVELFAGCGAESIATQHYGFRVLALAEDKASKQRCLAVLFPGAKVLDDALDFGADAASATGAADYVYGGIPCQLVAPNGKQLGLNDPRAALTVLALPRAAKLLVVLAVLGPGRVVI